MTTDLSVCQDIFSRDPVRYVDMTEAVRRGIGAVLYASPSAALVGIPSPDCPEVFDSYLMSCADMDAAHLLCGLLPDGGDSLIAAHEDFYLPLLQDRFGLGFFLEGASFQASRAVTRKAPSAFWRYSPRTAAGVSPPCWNGT